MIENNNQNLPVPSGPTIAVFIGASASVLTIGILNYLAEASKPVKDLLTISKALGPWSGKVLFGYLFGIAVWLISWLICRKHTGNLMPWFILFIISLLIGSLLVFSPFLHLLL